MSGRGRQHQGAHGKPIGSHLRGRQIILATLRRRVLRLPGERGTLGASAVKKTGSMAMIAPPRIEGVSTPDDSTSAAAIPALDPLDPPVVWRINSETVTLLGWAPA